jgi:probable F420-dependent oxidoreductase
MSRRRLGLDVSNAGGLERRIEWMVDAERSGYQDTWTSEISDPDAFVTLALAARETSTVRLGVAIVPMGTRSVPALANAAASVATVAAERFILGLGVSTEVIVEKWHGMTSGKPLGRSRETIELMRQLLAGGKSDYDGEIVKSKGFRLRHPPTAPPPIALAAMGPKMMELAGEIADAVLLTFLPLVGVPTAIEAIHRGAERAGRDAPPEIIMGEIVVVTDDAETARAAFAREVAFYLSAPPYQRALTRYGFGEDVERGRRRWAEGNIDRVAEGVSPELTDALAAIGSYEYARQRFEDFWAAGIDTITITTPPGGDAAATISAFGALAKELDPA